MNSHTFNPGDPISILDFVLTFRRACKNLTIRKKRNTFLFSHSILRSDKKELLQRVEENEDTADSPTSWTGSLRSYEKVDNHILPTYADNCKYSTPMERSLLFENAWTKPLSHARASYCGRLRAVEI